MNAVNHRILAGSFLLLSGGSWLETAYAFLMGSIPDQVERVGSKRVFAHRGFSHDIGLWAGLLLFFLLVPGSPPSLITFDQPPWKSLGQFRTWVLVFPGLLHALCDGLTPKGVPFLGVRLALPLFDHGAWKEYVFAWGVFSCAVIAQAGDLVRVAAAVGKRMLAW